MIKIHSNYGQESISYMSLSRVFACLCNYFVCLLGRLGSLVVLPLIGTI